ncbi:MAG: potassium transporter TrkG [Planctomycetota bacterium]
MRFPLISRLLGSLLLMTTVSMAIPLLLAVFEEEGTAGGWLLSIACGVIGGLALRGRRAPTGELSNREGFAVVAFGWTTLVVFGALPYVFCGEGISYIDGVFETMSGYTTTGASILTDIEAQPRSVLFWRSLTHWFGGMGILVLSVAILPLLGVGGMQLMKAEAPGPSTEKLTPRIASTAKILWGVYVGLTVLQTVLLMFGGLDLFNAVCHTFGTVATGGFSTQNASVGAYTSTYVQVVITLFMFIAGVNFSLHFRALRGEVKSYWRDGEFRFYLTICVAAIAIITVTLWTGADRSIGDSLRLAAFHTTSIQTTTGFCADDFERWPTLAKMVLFLLMFLGGCAGSTGGGMKHIRVLILVKHSLNEIRRAIMPKAVASVRVRGDVIPKDVVSNILGFFLIYVVTIILGAVLLAALDPKLDMISSLSAMVTVLSNVGPGFGSVGAAENYAHIHPVAKTFLSFCMLLGRLELYTIIVLFSPNFWRG